MTSLCLCRKGALYKKIVKTLPACYVGDWVTSDHYHGLHVTSNRVSLDDTIYWTEHQALCPQGCEPCRSDDRLWTLDWIQWERPTESWARKPYKTAYEPPRWFTRTPAMARDKVDKWGRVIPKPQMPREPPPIRKRAEATTAVKVEETEQAEGSAEASRKRALSEVLAARPAPPTGPARALATGDSRRPTPRRVPPESRSASPPARPARRERRGTRERPSLLDFVARRTGLPPLSASARARLAVRLATRYGSFTVVYRLQQPGEQNCKKAITRRCQRSECQIFCR